MPRPFVFVNVAMSVDGKIDSALRKGAGISSASDKARVDQLRASVDAVMVGGHTLLAEDPGLTVRSGALRADRRARGLPENPTRVGLVSMIPAEGVRLDKFLAPGSAECYIFTTDRTFPGVIASLQARGAMVQVAGHDCVDLLTVLDMLDHAGIHKMLVEGGGTLIAEFFRLGLVDEFTVYVAPRIFAGSTSPTLADGPGFSVADAPDLCLLSAEKFDEEGGVLLHYLVIHKSNDRRIK